MRIPDRGSTTGDSQLDRLSAQRTGCPQGERRESPPPHRHIQDESAYESTGFFSFISSGQGGMRIPDRGSTTGDSQLDRLRAQRTGCPQGERRESIPPHRHIQDESAYESTGFFSFISSGQGGMRIPDRGSTTGDSQLDRLRAQRTGCPQGERRESIPPHRHIQDESAYESTGFFSFISSGQGGMRIPDRGSTTGDSQLDRLRAQRTGCPQGERRESIPPHRHIQDESAYESTGFFLLYSPPVQHETLCGVRSSPSLQGRGKD